jgi:Peptidase family C25
MPSPTPDKVIVTHKAALKTKYAAAGLTAIETALKNLIAADLARGLVTVVVDLSSSADATRYGFTVIPIASVGDAKKHKQAIDKIHTKTVNPAYLMLLGAVDVIPHVPLKNPVFTPDVDEDLTADSDLPYACSAGYNTDPRKFVAPSRVVGRLPDLTGGTDPAYLVKLIGVAANYTQRPRAMYDPYMGLSAQVWQRSTEMSLDAVFGGHADLQNSPPIDHPTTSATHLDRLSHFINCHGSAGVPRFSGEDAFGYPTALDASQLIGVAQEGTVVAAECCYGAELYNPTVEAEPMGVCNAYLGEKTYGFFGSSTIAYGPPDDNDLADLICQFFLKHVRDGASIGRACLLARLDYVSSRTGTLTGHDLKTLAQFNLLGDPALTPVPAPTPHAGVKTMATVKPKGMAGAAATAATRFVIDRFTRDDRRAWLRRYSNALAGAAYVVADAIVASVAGKKEAPGGASPAVAKVLRAVALEMGMKKPTVLRFGVGAEGGTKKVATKSAKAMKATGTVAPVKVHVVMERTEPPAGKNAVLIRGFEAVESDGMLTVRKFVSR